MDIDNMTDAEFDELYSWRSVRGVALLVAGLMLVLWACGMIE